MARNSLIVFQVGACETYDKAYMYAREEFRQVFIVGVNFEPLSSKLILLVISLRTCCCFVPV